MLRISAAAVSIRALPKPTLADPVVSSRSSGTHQEGIRTLSHPRCD